MNESSLLSLTEARWDELKTGDVFVPISAKHTPLEIITIAFRVGHLMAFIKTRPDAPHPEDVPHGIMRVVSGLDRPGYGAPAPSLN